MYTKNAFTIDMDENFTFFGIYDSSMNWNGFKCPYFDKYVSAEILANQNSKEETLELGEYYYEFSEDGILEYVLDGEDLECNVLAPITFDGVKYYPIGFCTWVWQIAHIEETENQ